MVGGFAVSWIHTHTHTHTLHSFHTREGPITHYKHFNQNCVSISIYLKCFLWSTENLFWRPILNPFKRIFKYLWLLWTNIITQTADSGWPCLGKGENEGKWGYHFTSQFPHFSDIWFALHWKFPHQSSLLFLKSLSSATAISVESSWEHINTHYMYVL